MTEPLDLNSRLTATLDTLTATLHQFEQTFSTQHAELSTRLDRISASAETDAQQRIAAFEAKIADLEARLSCVGTGVSPVPHMAPGGTPGATQVNASAQESLRKTLPPSMCALLAKSATTDLDAAGHFDLPALDKALSSLSVDQRIAVKAEMARAGLIA